MYPTGRVGKLRGGKSILQVGSERLIVLFRAYC